jgi:hypothetical protein
MSPLVSLVLQNPYLPFVCQASAGLFSRIRSKLSMLCLCKMDILSRGEGAAPTTIKPRQDDQHRIRSEEIDERKCTLSVYGTAKNLRPGQQCVYPSEVSLPDLTKIT